MLSLAVQAGPFLTRELGLRRTSAFSGHEGILPCLQMLCEGHWALCELPASPGLDPRQLERLRGLVRLLIVGSGQVTSPMAYLILWEDVQPLLSSVLACPGRMLVPGVSAVQQWSADLGPSELDVVKAVHHVMFLFSRALQARQEADPRLRRFEGWGGVTVLTALGWWTEERLIASAAGWGLSHEGQLDGWLAMKVRLARKLTGPQWVLAGASSSRWLAKAIQLGRALMYTEAVPGIRYDVRVFRAVARAVQEWAHCLWPGREFLVDEDDIGEAEQAGEEGVLDTRDPALVGWIALSPARASALKAVPDPASVQELRAIVGTFTFFGHYIPNQTELLQPLLALLQPGCRFVWGPREAEALQTLKDAVDVSAGTRVENPPRKGVWYPQPDGSQWGEPVEDDCPFPWTASEHWPRVVQLFLGWDKLYMGMIPPPLQVPPAQLQKALAAILGRRYCFRSVRLFQALVVTMHHLRVAGGSTEHSNVRAVKEEMETWEGRPERFFAKYGHAVRQRQGTEVFAPAAHYEAIWRAQASVQQAVWAGSSHEEALLSYLSGLLQQAI